MITIPIWAFCIIVAGCIPTLIMAVKLMYCGIKWVKLNEFLDKELEKQDNE